jgi:anti-anti-sigma factor
VLSQHVEPFSCNVTQAGDETTVSPRGELDMATAGAVEAELRRARRAGSRSILLDLSGLTFMDSSGLHLVTRWVNESSRDGFGFELEPGPPAIQRVFELAALTDELPFRSRP